MQTDAAQEVALEASRFNRHTFWCGQSGSGKTYALGVVLEQLLLHTELPMLILDPNSDFVRLNEAHPDSIEDWSPSGVRVFRSGAAANATEAAVARYSDLRVPSKAAIMRLDPILDAEEYNLLLSASERVGNNDRDSFVDALLHSENPDERKLGLRVANLELDKWDVWSWGLPSITDALADRPRAVVADLGGFDHREEAQVLALAALEFLWNTREEHRPILIVIDEAHNLCPPKPATAIERALVDIISRIAAEGRKFGLWLLLSTQRPTKIHINVLSQCYNLALFKMNSAADLHELAQVFSFVPENLFERAPNFRAGQSLFAGGFIDKPTLVQMGPRLSREGGSDVSVPLPNAL